MALGSLVKTLQNIMRKDAGINGDAQRIEQMTWLFFLKIYDAKEQEWEFHDDSYQSIIPERLRWYSWAHDAKDGKALTGDELLDFVNNDLFKTLESLELAPDAPLRHVVVKAAFTDANNYMKDGILLRQVVNEIDESVDFTEYKERHAFGEIYETILKDLQSAGNAGEFYTPRAVTDFMAQALAPKLGETVADFACGTGGFLTSALKILDSQVQTPADRELYARSVYGIEKKQLPYLLCVTNMLLHDIDNPEVFHDNSLEKDVREWKHKPDGQFDVVLMNPPYGGSESASVQNNFPVALRSSETADLFLGLILYRLKRGGRAAVIIPDGFLFGQDSAKTEIKRRLLEDMNLHTVLRLPQSVFAPYTSITTNVLFFDNTGASEGVWFYRMDMPEGYKHFSKTKPIRIEHFASVKEWWENRRDIEEDGNPKAKFYTVDELRDGGFNFDVCGYPHEEEEILPPDELIRSYKEERAKLDAEIDQKLARICEILGMDDVMRAGRDGVSHFVGSMLYIPESESSATSISRVLLIDGQQRMTTFSLMIAALADYLEGYPDKAGFLGDLKISALRKNYLFNDDDYNGLARYKLVLSQDDKETLFSIVSGSPVPDEKSDRIVENHAFFREKMRGKSFDPARLWAGLNRVQVIDTKLTAGVDNAQLIFESMNSKGKPLTPIDLIRNYVLMSLPTTSKPSFTRVTGIRSSACSVKAAKKSSMHLSGTGCGSRFPIGCRRKTRPTTSSNAISLTTTMGIPRAC